MTTAEATQVLGVKASAPTKAVDAAYRAKVGEWGRRFRLATSPDDRDQAELMLMQLKEAEALLTGKTKNRPRSASARRSRPAPSPARGPTRPQRSPTLSPRPRPKPSPRPASSASGPRNGRFPRGFKVAAAALALGAFLSLMGRLSGGHSSSGDRPAVISVERASRGKVGNSISVVPARSRARALPVTVGRSGNGEDNPTPTPAESAGFLEVQSFPVAELFLDGRSVGYAPFRVGEKVKLSEGKHLVVLKNHRFAQLSAAIEIEAGRTHEIRCWLDSGVIEVSERR